MQDRYVGDIGDFAKYALLRALCKELKLGIAWYLYPDESGNEDGKHVSYLNNPEKWRHLDPDLFDELRVIVSSNRRRTVSIENAQLLADTRFSSIPLVFNGGQETKRRARAAWFNNVLQDLAHCDIVFADPDNGLCEDKKYRPSAKKFWKRMPLSEAHVLAAGRTAIVYHHNTRRKGGHANEIQYWFHLFSPDVIALYWRHLSNRTFFVIHPTGEIKQRALKFADKWSPYFELHTPQRLESRPSKSCPECGYQFKGSGWGGIDAHWKAHHADIMTYSAAWPLIRKGKAPSDFTNFQG